MRKDRPFSASLSDLSFQDLINVFKRQWWIFAIVLAVSLLLGVVFSLLQKPGHMSLAQMLIEGSTQSSPGVNRGDAVSAITDSVEQIDVLTQIQLLQSSKVFFEALDQVGIPIPQTDADIEKLPEVRVNQIGTTRMIQLSVVAEDANKARGLADALLEQYKSIRETQQRERVTRSLQFVQARLKDEQEVLTKLQDELSSLKNQSGILDVGAEGSNVIQVRASAQIALAEAERAVVAAQQRVASQRSALARLPKTVTVKTTTTNVVQIEQEKEKLDDLKRMRQRMLEAYYEDAPAIKQVDAEIKAQEARLATILQDIDGTQVTRNNQIDLYEANLAQYEAELAAAQSALGTARADVQEKTAKVNSMTTPAAKIFEKERALAERLESVRRLSATYDEIRLRDSELMQPVENVTPALPAKQVRPSWFSNLAIAGLLGLILGTLIALTRDIAQDKVNTVENATFITEKDILARIPLRAKNVEAVITDPSKARAFESYRLLRSSVLLATADESVGSFMVTSARGGEGKSTIAANFAVALAAEGKRVLVVDANLRSPKMHSLFKVQDGKGLTECVNDPTIVDEVLQDTSVSGLRVLTAGERIANPTELLGAPAMGRLVEVLKTKADFLVFDVPASFTYADAQALIHFVPTVLFVTDLATPTKSQLREGVAILDYAHANILGLVVNKDKSAASRMV